MAQPIHRVEMSGATISLILRELVRSRGDCDGLLYGRIHTRTVTQLRDDDEAADEATAEEDAATSRRHEVVAVVTGCCCTGSLFGFYDGAGGIDSARLAALTGDRSDRCGDPLLGWFAARRRSPMRASMRELAVSHNLLLLSSSAPLVTYSDSSSDTSAGGGAGSTSSGSPRLFMLLTESEADCIRTHEYRVFEYRGEAGMVATPVVVNNVGSGSGLAGFHPVAPLPFMGSGGGAGKRTALAAYADGFSLEELSRLGSVNGGAEGMEALYKAVLAKLAHLSRLVRESSKDVHLLKSNNK